MPIADVRFIKPAAVPGSTTQHSRTIGSADAAWETWQCQVVDLLRSTLFQELQMTTLDDVDWLTWQPYFSQGRSPRQAIGEALERAL